MTITAIDISPGMIERARPKAAGYEGALDLQLMDVQALEFADATFDSAVAVCTFCSVPDPVRGLQELYRCLKPGGKTYYVCCPGCTQKMDAEPERYVKSVSGQEGKNP